MFYPVKKGSASFYEAMLEHPGNNFSCPFERDRVF